MCVNVKWKSPEQQLGAFPLADVLVDLLEEVVRLSAVDIEAGAGDEVGLLRCEEGYGCCDWFRPAEFAHWEVAVDEFSYYFWGVVCHELLPGAAGMED